jgi:hypothetical protein
MCILFNLANHSILTLGCRNSMRKHQETSDRLFKEMSQLQSRYDAISEVKERAAERFKTDYQKWRKFKNWLFTDEEAKGSDGQELSAEEKKRRRNKNVLMKKKLVMELGLDYAENYPDGDVDGSAYSILSPICIIFSLSLNQHTLHLWVELHHQKNAIPRTTKRTRPLPFQIESEGD